MNTSSDQDFHDPKITIREPLHIIHSDKRYQVLIIFFFLFYMNEHNKSLNLCDFRTWN